MILYENNIDFRLLDKVTGGFLTALVIHAMDNFAEDEENEKEFGEEDYKVLCDYDYTAKNLSPEVLEHCTAILEDFRSNLSGDKKDRIKELEEDEQVSWGFDLYNTLVRGAFCIDEDYEPVVKAMTAVNAMPSIGKDDNGAIRIFFK
ncbi:hypothetical protein [Selenomonas ruminantium]|uniref:Uncharacterized protein n=1 Tax=Selenomonas ruminantium TaxID=971 RepID=A0A1I0V1P0_SELRU|nr:hypothetical protein [Selenomonas ruminantium]SFA70269.1 hypothetical protein SAMN05216587_101172 [Selenomonas ruminantium]